MPKVGMAPVRRAQLIESVIKCIDDGGLSKATFKTVSQDAGVSAGIIAHYFGNKQGLLDATMRHLLNNLFVDIKKAMSAYSESSVQERIQTIVEVNFDGSQLRKSIGRTWLSFWAESAFKHDLARLQNIYVGRMTSLLRHEFAKVQPRELARDNAKLLLAAIDGEWLRSSLEGDHSDPSVIRHRLNRLIALLLN